MKVPSSVFYGAVTIVVCVPFWIASSQQQQKQLLLQLNKQPTQSQVVQEERRKLASAVAAPVDSPTTATLGSFRRPRPASPNVVSEQQQQRLRGNTDAPQPTTTFPAAVSAVSSSSSLSNHTLFQELPTWVQTYMMWHAEQRAQFPDTKLFTDLAAPPVLIRTCLPAPPHGMCGGLHDRLESIASWLFVAQQTNRVLLIKWYRPTPLEYFVQPNLLNWTVPEVDWLTDAKRVRNQYRKLNLELPKTIRRQIVQQGNNTLYLNQVRERFDHNKGVKTIMAWPNALGLPNLANALKDLGETDTIEDTPTFGHIFHALFTPTERLAQRIQEARHQVLGSDNTAYVAVHVRARHPARFNAKDIWRLPGRKEGSEADETGLPWIPGHETQQWVLESALHAIHCAQQQARDNNGKRIFFFSDSEDLIHAVGDSPNMTTIPLQYQQRLLDLHDNTQHVRLKTRHNIRPVVHLDRGIRFVEDPDLFLDTFVDLYLAAGASCITYGYGNFAYLAAKISNTRCLQRHEEWPHEKQKGNIWNQQTHGTLCR